MSGATTNVAVPSFLEVVSADVEPSLLEVTPSTVPLPFVECSATPPPTETSFGHIVAPLDAVPPPEEIILHIQYGNDKNHYVLRLFVDGRILEQHLLASTPKRVIDRSSAYVITHARVMSAVTIEMERVLTRLREFVAQYQNPWLCIDELENTGIIWELLPIRTDEPPIGVLFNVWRRVTLLIGGGVPESSNWDPRPVRGKILSYCAPDVRAEWPKESHAPDPPDFKRLRMTLREGDPTAALIYIYCHSHPGSSIIQTTLGYLDDEEQVIDTSYILDSERKLLRESKPIVFLNACGTSRLPMSDEYLQGTSAGFANVFLKRGAVGVIATLAPVQPALAAILGEHVITIARKPDKEGRWRSVPEVLRVLRFEIHQQFKNAELMEDIDSADHYVHAFLYVYFGIPRAYLELA